MKISTLALRSLHFYWRAHLGVLAGATLAGGVLVGSLLVGDAVDYSLRRFALQRLGDTSAIMNVQGRFFDPALSDALGKHLKARTAAVLQLKGIAIYQSADGSRRQVNRIQVLGVDDRFWAFAEGEAPVLGDGEVAIGRKLAAALEVKEGDEISIRIGKPSLLPRDAPLASRKEKLSERGAFVITRILPDSQFGRFSLSANQLAPYNAFVSRAWLQDKIGLAERANLLLVGTVPPDQGWEEIPVDELNAALKDVWHLDHVGIRVRDVPGRAVLQLDSDRVFLDPETTRAALAVDLGEAPVGTLTYLVNAISNSAAGTHTPYSFVNALTPSANPQLGPVPAGMAEDEILINQWLADQLKAGKGDRLDVAYFELGATGEFLETSRAFTVRDVIPMAAAATETNLMPRFPGLTDVDTCRQWDIGMPMKEADLRNEANEAYWKAHRYTPKALVTLAAGQAMWANRFGNLSSVRYPVAEGKASADALRRALRDQVDPPGLGLFFLPVREQALRAVSEAMSFAELFVSMSFVLITAALMLTGLLFVFSVEQRAQEMGTLLAVGYKPAQVRRLFLLEGAGIALAGSLLGAVLGVFYTRFLIWGLNTQWQGAIAGAAIQYHWEWGTLTEGVVSGFACAVIAVAIALWRQSKRPARELLAGDFAQEQVLAIPKLRGGTVGMVLGVLCAAAAVGMMGHALVVAPEHAAMAFFSGGSLLLVAGLAVSRTLLGRWSASAPGKLSLRTMGIQNAGRRRGRSLTAIGLLACGCFMVLAVGSMKEDMTAHTDARWSGAGGFALFAESTMPVSDGLGTEAGRKAYNLKGDKRLEGVSFVDIKVHDGDNADCYNLNRAQAPTLLGVNRAALSQRKAFLAKGAEDDVWELLNLTLPDGAVPALVGDSDTAMWNLQKKVGVEKGDVLAYKDERGELFKVKLVGKLPMRLSVFQGRILVSAANFNRRYPSEGGYRMFLVDAPAERAGDVRSVLSSKLDLVGLEVTTTGERLAEFYTVQGTYLTVFLVLGGMGLLLGSAGLGVVVLRNVMERRGELALLRAVGFGQDAVQRLLLVEHGLLLGAGLVIGAVSAIIGVLPSLTAPGADVSVGPLLVTLALIVVSGVLWTVVATLAACRGDLIPALRHE